MGDSEREAPEGTEVRKLRALGMMKEPTRKGRQTKKEQEKSEEISPREY